MEDDQDLSDEEIDELIQINEEYARELADQARQQGIAGSQKMKDKALTDIVRDINGTELR